MIQEKALFQGVGPREYMRYKMSDLSPHQLSDMVGNAFLWPHSSACQAILPDATFHHCHFRFFFSLTSHLARSYFSPLSFFVFSRTYRLRFSAPVFLSGFMTAVAMWNPRHFEP